jgi:hypothetical protein
MSTETETRRGRCPTHGAVMATRDLPRVTFPWLVNWVRRALAARQPFRCPECGEPVDA